MVRSIDAIVSRSTLRDIMNRLRKILENCDVAQEDGNGGEGSGDEVRDRINRFQKMAKSCRELITNRNQEEQKKHLSSADLARMTHDCNVAMRDIKNEYTGFRDLTEKAVAEVARTNKKIAKAGGKVSDSRSEKLQARERRAKELETATENFAKVIESLEVLNSQRFLSAKESKEQANAPNGGRKSVKDLRLNQTMAQRLKGNARRKAQQAQNGGADEEDPDAPTGKRLDQDPETAEAAKELEKKKQQQDRALDIIAASLGRITQCALQIGQELDQQDQMLRDAEDKMDKATKDLKQVNKGLTKLLKDQKPMNCIINVMCFMLILGLLGFFLSEFGVF